MRTTTALHSFMLLIVITCMSFSMGEDPAMKCLWKKSPMIISGTVVNTVRCVRMEDGIDECIYRIVTEYVYKGKQLRETDTIDVRTMSYAVVFSQQDDSARFLKPQQRVILFVNKIQTSNSGGIYQLSDGWLGIQHYNPVTDKWLKEQSK